MRAQRVRLAAAAACAVIGCAHELGCDLDGVTRSLGGPGLMDCGIASSSDTSAVDDCAVTQYEMRGTFRAIYENKNKTLQAVVHAAGDKWYALRATASGDGVERTECKGGSIVTEGTRAYVQCDKPGTFAPACH
jgi:hypothetical protein